MTKKIIKAQMKQRQDTKANWAAANPVLLDGELGMVSDDRNLYKVGDGRTAWNDLPFRGFDGTLAQELGTSPNAAISQKAVTEKLTELSTQVVSNTNMNQNQAGQIQNLFDNKADKTEVEEQREELAELSAVIGGEDIEYNSSILVNQGLINSNGTIYPYESAYSYSNPIKVTKGQHISVTVNQTSVAAAATLFDADDKPIRTLIPTAYVVATAETEIEDGVAYVRFCSANNTSSVFKAFLEGGGFAKDLKQIQSAIDATNARVTEVSQDVDKLENDLTDEVNKLKDAALLLSATVVSHNKYNPSEAESGVYYRWFDGVKMERSDIASTGLIPCKANDEVYSFYGNTFYGGNVTFWDNKGNYVSGFDTTTSPWSVPDNSDIAFFRTSLYTSIINLLCININEKVEADTYREEYGYFADAPIVAPNIETLSQSIEDALKPSKMVVSHNVYNPAKAEIGYYYRWWDAEIIERSDIATTGLIPCKGGDVVYAFRLATYYGGHVTCWDKYGNFLEGLNATISPYTIPNNAKIAYFRTSFPSSIKDSLCININGKYDDDVYKEEEAYWSEIPIYAPNINAEENASIVKYYSMTRDSVTSIYGRNNDYGTSFIFSVIAKKNYEDAAILPRLKGTSDTSDLGDNNCTTVLAYAKKHQYQHIINAGIFLLADNTADGIIADGITIMNGNILKDGVCELFNVEQYVLGIKANGEMKSYRGMTAQQILDDGCVDAVTGFVPLFENSAAVDNTILSICPHYNIKHPRQIVGILSTGDFFTFCCDGRTDGEEGMTLKECINTLSELASIKYAFNLDGGGSTQTATYHKEVNRRLDGRKVPNVIAFVE